LGLTPRFGWKSGAEVAYGKRRFKCRCKGVTSQQEIERVVREQGLEGKGKHKVKMVLTAEGPDLRHEVDGEIDLD
jgi:hypothetical protein